MCSCSSRLATTTTRNQANDGTPADLTNDEERDSSREESDDNSVCDNNSDFNDSESSDKEV